MKSNRPPSPDYTYEAGYQTPSASSHPRYKVAKPYTYDDITYSSYPTTPYEFVGRESDFGRVVEEVKPTRRSAIPEDRSPFGHEFRFRSVGNDRSTSAQSNTMPTASPISILNTPNDRLQGAATFRPFTSQALSGCRNKETISRDITTGDEARMGHLLSEFGKKCSRAPELPKLSNAVAKTRIPGRLPSRVLGQDEGSGHSSDEEYEFEDAVEAEFRGPAPPAPPSPDMTEWDDKVNIAAAYIQASRTKTRKNQRTVEPLHSRKSTVVTSSSRSVTQNSSFRPSVAGGNTRIISDSSSEKRHESFSQSGYKASSREPRFSKFS